MEERHAGSEVCIGNCGDFAYPDQDRTESCSTSHEYGLFSSCLPFTKNDVVFQALHIIAVPKFIARV